MLIDMHHHLIYGLDDGAQSEEDMRDMLRAAADQGVTHIIATPHATPGREPFRLMEFLERVGEAKAYSKQENLHIRIEPGCEIFYTDDTVRMLNEHRIPTMAQGRYVLCEFGVEAPFAFLCRAAEKLGMAGYQPVFAHVERYRCLRKRGNLRTLHDDYDVMTQINARTFLKAEGFMTRRWLHRSMEQGLVDLAASDAHNIRSRNCLLGDCRAHLARVYGEETARALCEVNPRRILRAGGRDANEE